MMKFKASFFFGLRLENKKLLQHKYKKRKERKDFYWRAYL